MRNAHLADQPTADRRAEHRSSQVHRGVLGRLAPSAMVAAALAFIFALVGAPDHGREPSAVALTQRHGRGASSQSSARTDSNPQVNVTIVSVAA